MAPSKQRKMVLSREAAVARIAYRSSDVVFNVEAPEVQSSSDRPSFSDGLKDIAQKANLEKSVSITVCVHEH